MSSKGPESMPQRFCWRSDAPSETRLRGLHHLATDPAPGPQEQLFLGRVMFPELRWIVPAVKEGLE